MKHLTSIACAILVVAVTAGCNIKEKMEKEAQLAAEEALKAAAEEVVKEAAVEPAPEPAPVAEEVKMAVAKEDIEHAADIYEILHDEALTKQDAVAKVKEKLGEFGWDQEKYEAIQYEISLCPNSRAYYKEKIEG